MEMEELKRQIRDLATLINEQLISEVRQAKAETHALSVQFAQIQAREGFAHEQFERLDESLGELDDELKRLNQQLVEVDRRATRAGAISGALTSVAAALAWIFGAGKIGGSP